ncbi:hypothetical protein MTO96_042217, partial [Rhipicephalus appendiculatus]
IIDEDQEEYPINHRPKKLGTGGKHANPKVPASSTGAVTAGGVTESVASQGMNNMGSGMTDMGEADLRSSGMEADSAY